MIKKRFTKFPMLRTQNLILIELQAQHAQSIFRHFSNHQVTQFLDVRQMTEIAEAKRLIEFLRHRFRQERGIRWGIIHRATNQLIGTCGYNTWRKRKFEAELGYDLSPKFWRQGLASEAVNKIIQFGYIQMDLQTIEAYVMPENTASEQFLQKLGFTWEGTVKEFQNTNAQYTLMAFYRLKRREWILSRFVYH